MTTKETDERHAVSDDRNGAGSPVDDADSDVVDVESTAEELGVTGTRSQTAVATRPQRPTGKRTRRPVTGTAAGAEPEAKTDSDDTKSGDVKKPKTDKKQSGPSRNPFLYVVNFLKQVVAELRKVIWPNRKQMISYTTVVLVFLAFMVSLIGGVDLGLAKLVTLVFG
ncbi:preprotein translocase subunit SecE [Mycobacterium yunnanensis]|uniref:Protein translocase subunit SecE n=1 Tax=Mycobacterium yunnanensis TaxID=368477 RepID=A0A9X3C1M1_9MYCO|nr:preprotein translocase subunit SecE [Mycobacterium yunnanensis]MCV7421478.1 preprotein translocase subunit SecE [Mycobacterium yunnanensis]